MKGIVRIFLCCLLWAAIASAQTQPGTQASPSAESEKVPVMDGEAGPCSVELTVVDPDGKTVYAATIKVHIAYGFGGIRRLDLQAGTNSQGKVKFIGLPARVRRPPLEFHASKDELSGTANDDPAKECQATHKITLAKSATSGEQQK